ncbi:ABC transporter permease [Gordonia phthalatica]|uniref:ABC transmembrane type-1 domain-containing protein n=1 Tax=Gordonia phthalatica TaxID=1136941 RepID=A0A0N9NCC5_9ACTN|nr:ABC transporter permease [Gordonia phthalatica]ALG86121.1 hypothetical protein ACH46_18505 [Gordonia phthalatica]
MTTALMDRPAVQTLQVKPRRVWSKNQLLVVSIITPIVLFIGWELLSRLGVLDERFFPAPTRIFRALGDQASNGDLWTQSKHSIGRLIAGFLIGAVPGVVLGIVMGLSKIINAAIRPISSALYAVPKSAVLPLFLLFFGLGEDTAWYFVAVGAFFPVLINTYTGVANVSTVYYDVAENFGARKLRVFRTVALPGATPNIITGLELGAGMALIMLAIVEMLGGLGNGWGFMVWNSYQLFIIDQMYAYLLIFAIVGLVFAIFVGWIGRRLTPWAKK